MKFSNWKLNDLIEYLQLAKCGTDYTCETMVWGEIHIFNGEKKDGSKSVFIGESEDEDR